MSSNAPPIRRSIEVEYWVIDDEGRLTTPGPLVDAAPGAEREFVEPMLEIKTSPCDTMDELRDELLSRIRSVLDCADDVNKGLVPLATSLNRDAIRELPSDRTRIQNRVFGPSFQYVRHCAGTHIHFEQQPGHAIDQLNTLIALDPALALLNSARHFRGKPLVDGARSELYRRRAYDGCPHQGRLWSYVSDRQEWDRRLKDCYEDFCTRPARPGRVLEVWYEKQYQPLWKENGYFDTDRPYGLERRGLDYTGYTGNKRCPDIALEWHHASSEGRIASGTTPRIITLDPTLRSPRPAMTDGGRRAEDKYDYKRALRSFVEEGPDGKSKEIVDAAWGISPHLQAGSEKHVHRPSSNSTFGFAFLRPRKGSLAAFPDTLEMIIREAGWLDSP